VLQRGSHDLRDALGELAGAWCVSHDGSLLSQREN
jgi:hypothetical protein